MRWKLGTRALAGMAAALLAATSGCGWSAAGAQDPRTVEWEAVPPGPLTPREAATGFWTGKEVVLVGGSDATPCPPNASCRPPSTPPLADGVAFDPVTGSWRRIADAPVGFEWASVVVLGSTAYLWIPGTQQRPKSPSAFLAYRSADDRWLSLALPTRDPEASYFLLAAGDRIVATSLSDESGELPDLLFDPAIGEWSSLPDDPFSPGFDRVIARDGEELVLFDHELVPNPGGDGSATPTRGAVLDLDGGTWRVLEDSEARAAGLVWTLGGGWVVDSALAETPPSGAELAGVLTRDGASYTGWREGLVRDAQMDSWLKMPEPDRGGGLITGDTVVGAGSDLFVFGGARFPSGELSASAWIWSPQR